MQVAQWTLFEQEFTAEREYADPFNEVRLNVRFTGPDGSVADVPAFWDGGKTWKIRFSPETAGAWRWQSVCRSGDNGLDGQEGTFMVSPYSGDNPVYKNGALRMRGDRRCMEYSDGTPFFWLADTVWNGCLQADEKDWDMFLEDRVQKKFNVIQFVITGWFVNGTDKDGQATYTAGPEGLAVNPDFFKRMDRMVTALNSHGLIAAPVVLWAVDTQHPVARAANPGTGLPEAQQLALARYIVSRYNAYQVAWILGGDGNYLQEKAEPWKRIGRDIFSIPPRRVATMHAGGQSWPAEEFRHEDWFCFNGYQSGHGDGDERLRWLTQGPPAVTWKNEPFKPDINLEPNYEFHIGYELKKRFTPYKVRRAAYWSLLVSPPAGITYGGHGVWSWQAEDGPAPAHPTTGQGMAWHRAMHMPGSAQMAVLYDVYTRAAWWDMRPDQELVAVQPGRRDAGAFIAAACRNDKSGALVYVPEGGQITLNTAHLDCGSGIWIDPRIGTETGVFKVTRGIQVVETPDGDDWVLLLT